MEFESKATSPTARNNIEFAQLTNARKPLELLRDTEAWLRRPTVATLKPILSPKLSQRLQSASFLAEESLQDLAEIDINKISDFELHPARIHVGLTFVGFGALFILVLLLYINTLHPELTTVEQIRKYWYQYIWCVSLGVAGMFILGREAMRYPRKR
ncbi:hypothetical protein H6G54_13920 [Anabaena cylindrica FACHB-243]|uniref:Uncharacterized protein n=1 Tax=Anabaena cylindrica (strain ATCC 27899 / PCC 7122) TaxID=272123 RepID=K9ZK27_ANACC|nr:MULTISPECIES: hypothetical protein [Anabaena]AFZ59561.1 hypothetical protein Anacy_4195 [Anabaena cylindrica PCC 7122]MBD2418773.1 hypothetical protein [Anabaena cylindrica FACHB-243]MBY5284759.1 hypothetical protein [Anabaena sp. CCAP 1446/1C]MBY5310174.1 hypothetical protein [Anabaena sp. CCAP 1446/1C]MCM2406338.1 hypothetical protein [Anabaena sp. CCAP 1446/1C]